MLPACTGRTGTPQWVGLCASVALTGCAPHSHRETCYLKVEWSSLPGRYKCEALSWTHSCLKKALYKYNHLYFTFISVKPSRHRGKAQLPSGLLWRFTLVNNNSLVNLCEVPCTQIPEGETGLHQCDTQKIAGWFETLHRRE